MTAVGAVLVLLGVWLLFPYAQELDFPPGFKGIPPNKTTLMGVLASLFGMGMLYLARQDFLFKTKKDSPAEPPPSNRAECGPGSAQLQAIQTVIVAPSTAVSPPTPTPSPPARAYPPHPRLSDLTPLPKCFLGRKQELDAMERAVGTGSEAVVCVFGLGGQGKSSLVRKWWDAHGSRQKWDGVFWWNVYRSGAGLETFLPDILDYVTHGRFNPREMPQMEQQANCLADAIRGQHYLIVLDGFERWLKAWQGVDDPQAATSAKDRSGYRPAVDALLRQLAALDQAPRIIITSRAIPTALDGIQHSVVVSPGEDRLQGLGEDEGVDLLGELQVHGPEEEIREAVRDFKGHPKALTLLGGLLRERYGGDINKRPQVKGGLEDRLDELLKQVSGVCHDEKPLLEAAALCIGHASVGAMVQATGWTEERVRELAAALHNWQLVDWDGGAGTLTLHPLVRAHFAPSGEPARPLHARLAAWYASRPIPENPSIAEDIRPRLMAIEHARLAGDVERCAELLFGKLTPDYSLEVWFNEFGMHEAGIDLLNRLEVDASGSWLATVQSTRGNFLPEIGRLRDSLTDFDRAIKLFTELIDREGRRELRPDLARALACRAGSHDSMGQYEAALADYSRGISLLTELVEREGQCELEQHLAGTLTNRGITHGLMERFTDSLSDYNRAVDLFRKLVEGEGRRDLRQNFGNALMNRGNTYANMNQQTEALADLSAAIDLLTEMINREGRQELRSHLALSLMNRGTALTDRFEDALQDYNRAIDLFAHMVDHEGRSDLRNKLAHAFLNRAVLVEKRDGPLRSLADWEKGISVRRELLSEGRLDLLPTFLKILADAADTYIQAGRPKEAAGLIVEGLSHLEQAQESPPGATEGIVREGISFFRMVDRLTRWVSIDTNRLEAVRAKLTAAAHRLGIEATETSTR